MLMNINDYALNAKVENYPDGLLLEFSDSSYQWASDFGMQRIFQSEKFYWAENDVFLGEKFKEAIVAAVNDVIYKISFRLYLPDSEKCTDFRVKVFQHLTEQMGDGYEMQKVNDDTKLIIWASDEEGNVILELSGFDTNIILTSSMIRNAKKRSFFGSLFGARN